MLRTTRPASKQQNSLISLMRLEKRIAPALAITQITLPTANSGPVGIVSQGDESYVTAPGANAILRVDKTGGVETHALTTTAAWPMGMSPDGFWFTERFANKIGYVELGVIHEFDVPTAASSPWDIVQADAATVWFTERDASKIGRAVINFVTQTATFTEFPLSVARSPSGITVGPDGNIWFTEESGFIGRITPAGVITESQVPTFSSTPTQIVSGPDGNLWFTEATANKIGRITPNGDFREFNLPTPNSQPAGITATVDDIWFTETASAKIGRLNLHNLYLFEYDLPPGSAPTGIDASPLGTLWITEPGINKVATFDVPKRIVTGADAGGGPLVQVFDSASNQLLYQFYAYEQSFAGGVRVASADVNGDMIPDILTGAGPGGGPHVRLFDGKTGQVINESFVFDSAFRGGVYVALGHRLSIKSQADTYWETVVGAGPGGGPNVRVFKTHTGEKLGDFYAFDESFRGGVRVAAGEGIQNDPPIVVGAGPGGGPHVKLVRTNGDVIHSFFAYAPAFSGGVYVGIDYHLPNLVPTIITGAGEGGGSHVREFSGIDASLEREFFAYDPAFRGGVRLATSRGFSGGSILTGAGPSGGPHVYEFDPITAQKTNQLFAYDPTFLGGVFVA